MKTPGKTQKKQNPSDTPGSKASEKNKTTPSGKSEWKNPDPTNPSKFPEKINEPYARTNATVTDKKINPKPGTAIKKEKITNAGESEHHIPVNKSDYESFEDEYEDFEFEEEEDEEFEEDEDGETSSNYNYEDEEDESKQFRSKVVPPSQKKLNEQNNLQKQNNKTVENKNKSQLPSNLNQKKNNNPQG